MSRRSCPIERAAAARSRPAAANRSTVPCGKPAASAGRGMATAQARGYRRAAWLLAPAAADCVTGAGAGTSQAAERWPCGSHSLPPLTVVVRGRRFMQGGQRVLGRRGQLHGAPPAASALRRRWGVADGIACAPHSLPHLLPRTTAGPNGRAAVCTAGASHPGGRA